MRLAFRRTTASALLLIAQLAVSSAPSTQPGAATAEEGGLGSIKATSSATSPTHHPLAATQSSCVKRPLSQRLWQDLDLDGYLQNYTGGKTLSVVVSGFTPSCPPRADHSLDLSWCQAFANQVNMTNFACGIGQYCDAGEVRVFFSLSKR